MFFTMKGITMKKTLVLLLSLLMVFLMVPVLPEAVYAEDAPARGIANVQHFPNAVELPELDMRGTPAITRVMGSNRYETSLEVAKELLKLGAKFDAVIISTGDAFPDALAGSALSVAAGAPILLISPKVPSTVDAVIDFIKTNLEPDCVVFILGGTGAVPSTVESKLTGMGFTDLTLMSPEDETSRYFYRLAGKDRYETNLMVLELLRNATGIHELMFCDGTNWPDAATASAVGLPMMLLPKAGPTAEQIKLLDQIGAGKFYVDIIGGTGAVSDAVLNMLAPYCQEGPDAVWRIAGANRAETAAEVARMYFLEGGEDPSITVDGFTFAYGANFPDTISGGLLAHVLKYPILYGDSKVPAPYLTANAAIIAKTNPSAAYVLGGPTLVSDDFISSLYN